MRNQQLNFAIFRPRSRRNSKYVLIAIYNVDFRPCGQTKLNRICQRSYAAGNKPRCSHSACYDVIVLSRMTYWLSKLLKLLKRR